MSESELILSILRSCSHCGSFWGTTDILCGKCWRRIENAVLQGTNQLFATYRFNVRSLLNWNHQEHDLIKNLIHSLKTGWSKPAYKKFANYLDVRWPKESVLVPAPGPAHAKSWAMAISEITGLEVQDSLVKLDNGKQKIKNRLERLAVKMTSKLQFLGSNKRIIFVDDVITTGATALAAFKALGEPKHFEVCSIVCNPSISQC